MDTATKLEQTVTGQPPYQQFFTLSKACRLLGIGKSTMKNALICGEVAHTTNAQGHYKIAAAELYRYQGILDEARDKYVSEEEIERLRTAENTSSKLAQDVISRGVQEASDWDKAGYGEHVPLEAFLRMFEVTEAYKITLEANKAELIEEYKHQVERYVTQLETALARAERYEAKADNLLTDQRELAKLLAAPVPPAEEGRAVWPWLLTIAILLGLGLYLYSRSPVT